MPPSRFTRLLESLPATVPFIAPDALERKSGRPLKLRLGANESMFGTSPRASAAMHAAMERVHCYGDPDSFALRQALAKKHGVKVENIVIGAGIDDLLDLAVRALVEQGSPVVASLGSYPTFAYSVAGYGGELHRVPYANDKNDLAALLERARETGAKVVYLANPDNPSGSFISSADIIDFLFELPRTTTLILDEAYAEFGPEGDKTALKADDPRIIRMRTFSKLWGLAGARIGYAVTARETVAALDKIRTHFAVNAVAQAGALASLGDEGWAKGVLAAVAEGREDYSRMASDLGFRALPSATNFVTIDVGREGHAKAILEKLLARDVFIRMPFAPPLSRCIRVTIGTPEQRALFETALREVVA